MKIAFCFAGHVRTGQYAVENIIKFIGDLLPNVDVFCHTWIDNQYKRRYVHSPEIKKIVNELNQPYEVLRKRKDIFDPFTAPSTLISLDKISEQFNQQFINVKIEKFLHKGLTSSKIRRPELHSWNEVLNQCQEYQKINNFQYDYIVKTRLDLVLHPESRLSEEIEHYNNLSKKISGPYYTCTNNVLLLASAENMNILTNLFCNKIGSENDITFFRTRKTNFAIYRPESIPHSALDFDKIRQDDLNWYWRENVK